MQLYAYMLPDWDGYLIRTVCPEAVRISARPLESGASVCQRVGADAQAFVFHVDLTNSRKVPPERAELCTRLRSRGVLVLNEQVVDVSRRFIHRTCAALGLESAAAPAGGDPDEWLFLKSNRNFGGLPERRLPPRAAVLIDCWPVAQTCRDPTDYRKVRRRDIGTTVKPLAGDVIERYIDNERHIIYRLFLLRDHLVVSEVECRPVLVRKMEDAIDRSDHFCRFSRAASNPARFARLIDTARTFRDAIGLDYGSIDVLMDDDGRYTIIDVNLTPWSGTSGQRPGFAAHLRAGLVAAQADAGVPGTAQSP